MIHKGDIIRARLREHVKKSLFPWKQPKVNNIMV